MTEESGETPKKKKKAPASAPDRPLDPMIVDPDSVQQETFEGSTSNAASRVEGTSYEDVTTDPNNNPDKASDAEDYAFPPGGDVDVATVDAGSGEGELFSKPTAEDWVVLDGASDAVPDQLDGRRAAILQVYPEDAFDTRDLLKEEFTPDDLTLTVRTRDDYNATLSIPWAAVKRVEKRGVTPVR